MPLQDWIDKPWPVILAATEEALLNHDILTLQDLDAVVRDRFIGALKRREPVGEVVAAILNLISSPPAAATLAETGEIEKLLAQWDVLVRLAEAEERIQASERNAVERHVIGRPRRQQIFDILSEHREIRFQELKSQLAVSDANLSGLLGELEAHAIVERERRGSETWVRLGPAGIAHACGNVVELRKYRVAIGRVLPDDEWLPRVKFA